MSSEPAGAFWYDGRWSDQQPHVAGPMDLGFWSAVSVFDGARSIGGLAPDLDRHCQRVVNSARAMMLEPTKTAEEIRALCIEGIRRLPRESELYIRPMFWGTRGLILPEPGATEFALAIFDAPMPPEIAGSACLSSFRRNAPDQAPTDAKAGCLYPNAQRAEAEAIERGFDFAVMLGPDGTVSEYAHANIWMAKDGVAATPAPNGTFLNGITRQRVIGLLRDAGTEVEERTIRPEELMEADEIFVTGNYGKVQALTRYESRELQPGPVFRRARSAYREFMKAADVFDLAA